MNGKITLMYIGSTKNNDALKKLTEDIVRVVRAGSQLLASFNLSNRTLLANYSPQTFDLPDPVPEHVWYQYDWTLDHDIDDDDFGDLIDSLNGTVANIYDFDF